MPASERLRRARRCGVLRRPGAAGTRRRLGPGAAARLGARGSRRPAAGSCAPVPAVLAWSPGRRRAGPGGREGGTPGGRPAAEGASDARGPGAWAGVRCADPAERAPRPRGCPEAPRLGADRRRPDRGLPCVGGGWEGPGWPG